MLPLVMVVAAADGVLTTVLQCRADNDVCGAGAAPKARVAGVKVLGKVLLPCRHDTTNDTTHKTNDRLHDMQHDPTRPTTPPTTHAYARQDPDDADEALAIGYMCDHPEEPVHVYSASWGPLDDGRRIEGPGRYVVRPGDLLAEVVVAGAVLVVALA
jgi:hypothetical protein